MNGVTGYVARRHSSRVFLAPYPMAPQGPSIILNPVMRKAVLLGTCKNQAAHARPEPNTEIGGFQISTEEGLKHSRNII